MIPETKQFAVSRGLQATFGVNDYEDIRLLTGGLSSALAFRITVRNNPYLLKIMREEVISNPAHEFACMQTAAEAGLAPRIWYANPVERILITDFVEARPLPGDAARVAPTLVAPLIRRIHTLPNFPKTVNYLNAIDGFIHRFQAAHLLPESETAELFQRYAGVQKVYPRDDADLVASHNDLKPQNMLFDGNQIWLVDWESAFLNDPYVDLAVAANFFVNDEAGGDAEENYLLAYFGEPAGEYRRARFYLMRQAVSMFYATLLLLEASRAGLLLDAHKTLPDFKEFHQGLISGKIDVMNAEVKLQYGLLHLREALRNMRSPQFEASLARVSDNIGEK